jgi:hypothetical protein
VESRYTLGRAGVRESRRSLGRRGGGGMVEEGEEMAVAKEEKKDCGAHP